MPWACSRSTTPANRSGALNPLRLARRFTGEIDSSPISSPRHPLRAASSSSSASSASSTVASPYHCTRSGTSAVNSRTA
jgi:hypothetical protein